MYSTAVYHGVLYSVVFSLYSVLSHRVVSCYTMLHYVVSCYIRSLFHIMILHYPCILLYHIMLHENIFYYGILHGVIAYGILGILICCLFLYHAVLV